MLYVAHGSADGLVDQFSNDPDKILCRVPLRMLVPKLTKPKLKEVLSFHGIPIPKRRTTDKIKDILSNHVCDGKCAESVSVFKTSPTNAEVLEKRRKRKQVLRDDKRAQRRGRISDALRFERKAIKAKKSFNVSNQAAEDYVFPADPTSAADEHRIISEMCKV
jgi:hypothetical protein